MRWRHVAATSGAVSLVLLATPAAAQSPNRRLIDSLNEQLIYVALPLTLFVIAILVYAVVRFRDNDDPEPTAEDPSLEITWTVATAIILLFVGVSAYSVLAGPYMTSGFHLDGEGGDNPAAIAEDEVVVEVVATQFHWQFTYPEADVTTRNELVIPVDEDVTLAMTSRDVIHSLAIQELGIKQDVFPGSKTYVRTTVDTTGVYQALCIEFCGARHSHMQANVTVVEDDEYEAWLEEHRGEDEVTEAPDVDG